MKYLMKFCFAILWVSGIVLAKGFWSTFFAIFFAPWGWYLCVETALKYYGVL